MADFKEIGGCDPMTNGRAWRKMRNPAVKIATQSAPKLNPRSPLCTQRARIPRRTAGPLGCSNSSKGEENSPTRTECCAKIRVLSTVRVTLQLEMGTNLAGKTSGHFRLLMGDSR